MYPPLGRRKFKAYLLGACASLMFFLLIFGAESGLSGDHPAINFYPLGVGNEWQYKHTYYAKEMVGPDYSKILISSKADKGKGTVEFRGENGAIFMYKTKDGIISASGFLILRDPLELGAQWTSGIYNYDQRQHRVDAVGLTMSVEGKTYTDCIRIISHSDLHALVRDGQSVYLSFESRDVYCPNVGPVLMETFEITKSGGRKLVSRSELVSFRQGRAVKGEIGKEEKRFKLTEVNESFRFPEKGFYHPSLSPDDKWLIYHHPSFQRDASKRSLDTMWKQLFYSEVANPERRLVPLSLPDEKHEFENVGGHAEWSADGKTLALSARMDGRDHIVLVDFSGATPRFLESFKAEKRPFQWADGFLLYIDEHGSLMKKFPAKGPEDILNPGSTDSSKKGVDSFRCAKDGTLLYRAGGKIFRTDLKNLESRFMVHEDAALSNFDLSSTGRYVFISIPGSQDPSTLNVRLHDLKANKIYNIPVAVKKALFSPDGRRLAYIEKSLPPNDPSKGERKNPHFFILDVSSMEVRDYGYHVGDYFGWTPDGNRILYSMKCIHPSLAAYENGIFIMQVSNGKEIAKLTSINAAAPPVISLSGKYIIWEGMDMDTFFVVRNPL